MKLNRYTKYWAKSKQFQAESLFTVLDY